MRRIIILSAFAALALAPTVDGAVKRSWLARDAAGVEAYVGGGAPQMSDVVQDIWVDGSAVWVATVDGLGVTGDRGATWKNYRKTGLPSDDVLAVAARGGDIWASCIEVEELREGVIYHGRGLAHYDASAGRWRVYGKKDGLPADGPLELAWDVVVDGAGVVWVALWDGGIGKSADNGRTWELIVPKDREGRRAEHFYSLAKRGNLIWAAAEVTYPNPNYDPNDPASPRFLSNLGVFKSEDNGSSWTFYGARQGVIGFAVVVNIQNVVGRDVVWVGTAPSDPANPNILGNGVYKSEDGGASWFNYDMAQGLGSHTVYGFASAGPWAWAGTYARGTPGGVSRTSDRGATWQNYGVEAGLPTPYVTTVAAASATEVWAGTDFGLGYSSDSGATWRKIELTPPAGRVDLPAAFAFPSPFAQERDYFMTIRYGLGRGGTVTLDIYDFAGRRVIRLVNHEYRGPGERIDEYWRGEREDGTPAANGIYFFTLEVDGKAAARGKFVVLN
ncbi:MAG: hypothetical protein GTN49_00180 [candidate division Zixibacteria bacterium]|nr:hypothetical protein [candidate division Zixibacteria bacterium]